MGQLKRVLLALAGVALVALAIRGMAEATMTTYEDTPPDSATLVEFDAEAVDYSAYTAAEFGRALFVQCRLTVDANTRVESLEPKGDGEFVAVLSPALNDSDSRQLHGCLEDAALDRVQVAVERLERVR